MACYYFIMHFINKYLINLTAFREPMLKAEVFFSDAFFE